jgi:hypothetical protein
LLAKKVEGGGVADLALFKKTPNIKKKNSLGIGKAISVTENLLEVLDRTDSSISAA